MHLPTAGMDGIVGEVAVSEGAQVNANDVIILMETDA